jgi:hypothetical protein
MLMRGEATPVDIRRVLLISRQLVRYWCVAAGINHKEARRTFLLRELLKGTAKADVEHPEVKALRERLKRPRPTAKQLKAAHDRKVADLDDDPLSSLPPSGPYRY